ncbi:helicase HerA-like domain-containing protein [Phytomonospora sp. NPDC050363]|uniref:helicase HerA-like domain-containing protein n=1 Tax=Phytomonospora sp. NPDC050363 TaxID=3155642 RepID=UPI0033ED69F7
MAADIITTVTEGYAFDEPAVGVGALVDDDKAVPDAKVAIPLAMFNRHGLVAGATGTGKTVTLQVLAEQLAEQGVPVFLADIKGDLSGMATPGDGAEKLLERTVELGQTWTPAAFPVEFYALGGQGRGTPLRATMTAFGPTLLSKVLDLNDTQESSLGLIFHYADSRGLPLLDLKDLRAVVQHLTSDEGKAELKALGGLSAQTAGVILRALINFADQGADQFFGEPEFDPTDLLRTGADGRGTVSILELPDLQAQPAVFSTFLMWLLAELFQDLPEVGDQDRPKLVFFFDEAHLLFNGSSKAFLTAITQTVRLIRSKGVGVFFVTQTPKDVPTDVLAQLGARVQHALRAFTPQDAKALKATVSTFPHSAYDLEEDLTRLGIGEAMVTVLDDKGRPTPVAWTRMYAPRSHMGPSDEATMTGLIEGSAMKAKYGVDVDRDSAYEMLSRKVAEAAAAVPEPAAVPPVPAAPKHEPLPPLDPPSKSKSRATKKAAKAPASSPSGFLDNLAKSAATTFGREITRTLFGTAKRR